MARRGNPYAIVRLEPEVMKRLQDVSEPRQRGRGGGVSQYLRELVYSHLGLGHAPCFGVPGADFENEEIPSLSLELEPRPQRREPHAAPELA